MLQAGQKNKFAWSPDACRDNSFLPHRKDTQISIIGDSKFATGVSVHGCDYDLVPQAKENFSMKLEATKY